MVPVVAVEPALGEGSPDRLHCAGEVHVPVVGADVVLGAAVEVEIDIPTGGHQLGCPTSIAVRHNDIPGGSELTVLVEGQIDIERWVAWVRREGRRGRKQGDRHQTSVGSEVVRWAAGVLDGDHHREYRPEGLECEGPCVGSDLAEKTGVAKPGANRAVATERVTGDETVFAVGHRSVSCVDPGDEVVGEVVLEVSIEVRVRQTGVHGDRVACINVRHAPGFWFDEDERRHRARGDHLLGRVDDLRVIEVIVAHAMDEVDDGVVDSRRVVAVGQVHLCRHVLAQRVRVERDFLDRSGGPQRHRDGKGHHED